MTVRKKSVGGLAVLGVALSVMLSLCEGPAAWATHSHGASSGTLSSSTWKVCNTGTQSGRDAVVDALQRIEGNTGITTDGGYCDDRKNVNAHADWYAENWYGATSCTAPAAGDSCSAKEVLLNQRTISPLDDAERQWNKTARHVSQYFDAHDWAALNNTYP